MGEHVNFELFLVAYTCTFTFIICMSELSEQAGKSRLMRVSLERESIIEGE